MTKLTHGQLTSFRIKYIKIVYVTAIINQSGNYREKVLIVPRKRNINNLYWPYKENESRNL